MSKINVNTWEPESSTAATLMGASGDTTLRCHRVQQLQ